MGITNIIRADNVKKVYQMRGGNVHALRGITLDIFKGEYLSIMGPSGSGKSTFFNIVGALDNQSSGLVYVDGTDLSLMNSKELAWFRCNKIGYIFQTFNLIPTLTALENVMLAAIFRMQTQEQANLQAKNILEAVGLKDRMFHLPNELSGGQMQRVAIARALINKPKIVLADEPTGNLDQKTGLKIIELLCDLNKNLGVTIITATHDYKMLGVSDRIAWFSGGSLNKIQTKDHFKVLKGSIN